MANTLIFMFVMRPVNGQLIFVMYYNYTHISKVIKMNLLYNRLAPALVLALFSIAITISTYAGDSSAMRPKAATVRNYNAKIGSNDCYEVETREVLIQAQDGVGARDSANSNYCAKGYAAMRAGASMKVREVNTPMFQDVLRAVSTTNRVTCCKIIYEWE